MKRLNSKFFVSVFSVFVVVLVVTLLAKYVNASNWWNSNYANRKNVTIKSQNGAIVPKDATLTTTLDTQSLISGGKMRADGKDLRLVYNNNGTQSELDYEIALPSTRLLNDITTGDTAIFVDNGASLPTSGKIQIGSEIISYTGVAQTSTPTAVSSTPGNLGPDSALNDGDIDSYGSIHNLLNFSGNPNGWYEIDWPSAMTFDQLKFKEATWWDGWIHSYQVQYWDGSAWQNVTGASAYPNLVDTNTTGTWYKVQFNKVKATKVRLTVVQGGADMFSGLYELQVYNTIAHSNLARPVSQLTGVTRAQNGTTAAVHTSGDNVAQSLVNSSSTPIKFKVQRRVDINSTDSNYYLYYGYASESSALKTNNANVYYFSDEFTSSTLNPLWTVQNTTSQPTITNNAGNEFLHMSFPPGAVYDYIGPSANDAPRLYTATPFMDWVAETSVNSIGNNNNHAGIIVSFNKSNYDAYLWGVYCLAGSCSVRLENSNAALNIIDIPLTGVYGTGAQVDLRVRKVSDTYYFDYRLDRHADFINAGSKRNCCGSYDYMVDASKVGLFSKDYIDTQQLIDTYFDFFHLSLSLPDNGQSITVNSERAEATSGTVSVAKSYMETEKPIIVIGHDSQTSIIVYLKDSYGDPVAGKNLTLASSKVSDVITPSTGTTDANGALSVTLTSTVVGASTITAVDSDSNTITATNLITTQSIEPQGLDLYSNLNRLPYLEDQLQTLHSSASDPRQANVDLGNYRYKDSNNEYVLMDEKGPGIIYRFWMTIQAGHESDLGNIKMYFDGSATPTVNTDMNTFYGGTYQNLAFPIVSTKENAAGGFYNFVPMAFAHSVKITTTNVPAYYHITYQRLPADYQITSYTAALSTTPLLNQFLQAGLDPKPATSNQTLTGSGAIANGATQTIADLSGNGSIQSIKLKLSPNGTSVINGVKMKVYWDNEATPSIDVPVGYFFAAGQGVVRIRSLMYGYDDTKNEFYVYFPMPYSSHAKIVLSNESGQDISTSSYSIEYKSNVYEHIGKTAAFFKAHYNEETTANGLDHIFLSALGRGKVVALTNVQGGSSLGQEGNERIYLNGNGSPQESGTGSEDFFNGGWAFTGGPVIKPLMGSPQGSFYDPPVSMYSVLLGQSFNFQNGITLGIQHGPDDDIAIPYNSVSMYYHIPTSNFSLTDSVDVANSASELSHQYVNASGSATGSKTYKYAGSDSTDLTDLGNAITGYSQFKITIDSNNKGVMLRRRIDYSVANQEATVSVDGSNVGTWYDAGSNTYFPWRDTNFWIPSTYTAGKTSVTIKLANVGTNPFNEYKYTAYSILDPLVVPTATPTPTSAPTSIVSSIMNVFSPPSTTNPPAPCTDSAPGTKAPWLYSVVPQTYDSVLLYFASGDDPIDRYILEYGTSSGNYQYGVSNIGNGQARTYLVKGLSSSSTYYFKIRGAHGCATGPWSNEMSSKTTSITQPESLVITSSSLSETQTPQKAPVDQCIYYTVQSGDTWWSIATKELGDGNKYQTLKTLNPDIQKITPNAKVKIRCDVKTAQTTPNTSVTEQNGVVVSVLVLDDAAQPVPNATVTLHSTPQTTKTDVKGVATFQNVEPGNHSIIIDQDNLQATQSINVKNNAQKVDVKVTLQKKENSFPMYIAIGVAALIAVVAALIVRFRKKAE